MSPSRAILAAAAFAVVLTGNVAAALAGEGDLVVRLQGAGPLAGPQTAPFAPAGNPQAPAAPELGISYFITDNITADFTLDGNRYAAGTPNWPAASLAYGELLDLPPVVTLQYRFLPDNGFKAYIGAGLDYSASQDRYAAGGKAEIDYGDTFNYAFEAGFDYYFRQDWAINFDLKTVFIDRDVPAHAAAPEDAGGDLNPWAVGLGFTYNF